MMKWLTEIRASRCTLAEIGLLITVREVFRNKLEMTWSEAYDTLGHGWDAIAKKLQRAGMLKLEHNGQWMRMWVTAPGDWKRKRCRDIMRRKRAKERASKPGAARPTELSEVSFV